MAFFASVSAKTVPSFLRLALVASTSEAVGADVVPDAAVDFLDLTSPEADKSCTTAGSARIVASVAPLVLAVSSLEAFKKPGRSWDFCLFKSCIYKE